MNTTENTQGEEKIRYVVDLEDGNDYWLSITDAARVCRVQDVSIRRAIAAGRLPVRRLPVGENKRTRLVRASDLPRSNFPILDSTAAITSDIRKVDVLSLPLQQQRLAEGQQQILQEVVQANAQLAQAQKTQEAQATELATLRQAQEAQAKEIQNDLETMKQALAQQRVALQTALQQEQASREQALQAQKSQISKLEDALAALGKQYQSETTILTTRLNALEEASSKQTALLVTLQESVQAQFTQMQEHIQAQIGQVHQAMQEQIMQSSKDMQAQFQAALAVQRRELAEEFERRAQAIEADEAKDIASLTSQQERLGDTMNAVSTKMDVVDEDLRKQLQEEQIARAALEQRLTDVFKLLQEEIATRQGLSSEIAHLKTSSPRARKAQS